MDLSALKISVTLERTDFRKQRLKIDLYDYAQIEKRCCDLSEKEGFDYVELEADFYRLADLLEEYREELYKKEFEHQKGKNQTFTCQKKNKQSACFLQNT